MRRTTVSTGSPRPGTFPPWTSLSSSTRRATRSHPCAITDFDLLDRVAATGRPVIMSTGMSTMEEIEAAIERLDGSPLLVAHSTSSYPCPPSELNLRMIPTLAALFPDVPIGYSGHEVGLQTSVAAVALGATFVERHITLDRAMWGTDQAASVEPPGMARLVRDIRVVEEATGDGVKRVYDSEVPIRAKLRRVQSN
ncbi:MAG: N-acetylneuraminate synthase family protein [Acidimicrobiales bacterium]|nr:N-acetylneuraminate synthase family protein [Acidimicrobiales bacterium]